jgi:nicotinamidase/pyrazinamidase
VSKCLPSSTPVRGGLLKSLWWDVDTQVDFIHAHGKLAVPGAESIVANLAALTNYAHAHGIRIVATADDHDIGHAEITDTPDWATTFPPHCMRGTEGQRKIRETALRNPMVIQPVPLDAAEVRTQVLSHDGDILLNKCGTDVFRWNPNAITVLDALAPDSIVVYGVATDFCTRAAVMGLATHRPQAELTIVTDAIRGIDQGNSDRFLEEWRAAGHLLRTTAEVIA